LPCPALPCWHPDLSTRLPHWHCCSYNVHPIAHSLERFSNRRMMMLIRRAVRG
jgi:hypothetical protein